MEDTLYVYIFTLTFLTVFIVKSNLLNAAITIQEYFNP